LIWVGVWSIDLGDGLDCYSYYGFDKGFDSACICMF
jgi:hypothetical protein